VTAWVVLMFPNGGGTHVMLGEDEDRQNAQLLKHPPKGFCAVLHVAFGS
jgi:hypothetical protein